MEQTTPAPPSNDINAFNEEVRQPTEASLDGAPPPAADIKYDMPPTPPPGPAPAPRRPDQPMFSEEDLNPDAATETEQEPAPRTKPLFSEDYKKKTLRHYLKMEEQGTAWLFAKYAGTEDSSAFYYSEDTREAILTSLEPYMDVIIEALPPWVPVLFIYGGAKTEQFFKANKARQITKANDTGKRDINKLSAIASTVDTTIERKNFLLYIDGYYKLDRSGNYIKDRKGEGRSKLEKPSIDDLEKILLVNNNREVDLLCNAFDITKEDFARLGINI